MATKYITPLSVTGDGSAGNPWSVSQANAGLVSGDIGLCYGGIYKEYPNPAANGVTYKNAPGELPIFDGSRLSVGKRVAVPNPWDSGPTGDCPSETGWGSVTRANRDAGTNIWNKTVSSPSMTVQGVFVDSFDGASGQTAGRWATLWHMGHASSESWSEYNSNPDRQIHDGNLNFNPPGGSGTPTHSDNYGGFLQHGPEAQFQRESNGSVDIRIYGPTSTPSSPSWDPNHSSHKIYFTDTTIPINWSNKSGITLDGLRFYRFRDCVDLTNCPNVTFQNCWFMYAWTTNMWIRGGCDNWKLLNCKVFGGGSGAGHYEGLIHIDVASGALLQGSEIAWAGHEGIFIDHGASNGKILECDIHDTAGSQIFADRGATPTGWEIARNKIHGGNKSTQVQVHIVPHPGFQIGNFANSTVDDNLFYDMGQGILATGAINVTGNKFRGNTFDNLEQAGIRLNQDVSGGNRDHILNNLFTNNIVTNFGTYGAQVDLVSSSGPYAGNVFRNNDIWHPSITNSIRLTRQDPYGTHVETPFTGTVGGAPSSILTAGNIAQNPSYTHPQPNTYNITAASPAHDTGSANPVTDMSDTRNNIRSGSLPDMGWFEVEAGGGGGDVTAPETTIVQPAASSVSGNAPLTVTFEATASDPSTPLTYEWVFGDGTPNGTALGPFTHQYQSPGTYQATFRARDNVNNWSNPIAKTIQVLSVPDNAVKLTVFNGIVSSELGGADPKPRGNAFDGVLGSTDPTNYWAASPLPQWIGADVGGTPGVRKRVTRFRVYPIHWTTRFYTVDCQIANVDDLPAEAEWLTVAASVVTSTGEFTEFSIQETVARWCRIVGKSVSGETTQFFSLHEVEFYGKEIPIGQPGAEYTDFVWTDSRGTTGTFAPSKVADNKDITSGDPLSRWIGNPLPVDLIGSAPNLRAIGRLTLQPVNAVDGRSYTVRVDLSTQDIATPTVWQTVVPTTNTATVRETVFTFPPIQARHVRITWTATSDGIDCAQAWRAQVFAS
jgi:hypothetical protein